MKYGEYKKVYGMTCCAMAKKYGGTPQRYSFLHKVGRLHEFLAGPDNFKRKRKGQIYKTSKYLRLYGMRLSGLAEKYGFDTCTIAMLHEKGVLDAVSGVLPRQGLTAATIVALDKLGVLDMVVDKLLDKVKE